MNGSNEIIIGATNTQFIDGDRSARYPKREEYVDSGIMFLNGESISRGTINKEAVNFITEQKYRDIKKGRIARNDILLTTRGNSIGDAAFVTTSDKGLINAQMLILRVDSRDIHPKYLFYYITSNSLRNYILNFASGSAQPQIPIRDLKKIPIYLPKIQVQKKIAAILSAYDELIENNRRRIALLEKMAGEIYREWFVRLRFPGHKHVEKFKRVPIGWREAKLGDLIPEVGLQTGKRPIGGAQDSGIPSIGAENVVGLARHDFSKEKYVNEHFFDSMRQGHIADKDVLFYKDGAEIGRVTLVQDGFPHEKCCVNEHVFVIRTRDLDAQYFLYFYLNQEIIQEYVKTINKNAAQPGINKSELRSIPILLPHSGLIQEFENVVSPIIRQIFQLAKTQRTLTKTRDLLLPRLISGKLSVEHLDIQFPPGMEDRP
ncbi:MAG: restriction endonuclease subunit S [Nitrosomonadaceae bacterium]|nr:restriction endonuclease subunit S [Nitrosomonadaceae bacterium]